MRHLPHVLVVEDEQAIAELIAINLRHNGFQVTTVHEAQSAIDAVNERLPDLILLDWMLPGQSGIQLSKRWRSEPRTQGLPILMLTAKSEESDKIAGLDAGADDYITKPFSMQEMLARIRAVLRRRTPEQASVQLTLGDLVLDGSAHSVTWRGEPLRVGPTEYKLLNYLMHHPERVHSRSQLLDKVWGDHVFIEERTVDVHIKRLRQVLGEAGQWIQTVRGAGYKLAKPN
jgi:two-component system phosphate regulon response regulator PhoB